MIQTGLAVGFTSWGYMLWMAQSSYLSLAVVPAALYYTKLYNETRAHYNMETVKDIYYRKDDNTLDIYLWKEGNYSRVIEVISILLKKRESVLEMFKFAITKIRFCPPQIVCQNSCQHLV